MFNQFSFIDNYYNRNKHFAKLWQYDVDSNKCSEIIKNGCLIFRRRLEYDCGRSFKELSFYKYHGEYYGIENIDDVIYVVKTDYENILRIEELSDVL